MESSIFLETYSKEISLEYSKIQKIFTPFTNLHHIAIVTKSEENLPIYQIHYYVFLSPIKNCRYTCHKYLSKLEWNVLQEEKM